MATVPMGAGSNDVEVSPDGTRAYVGLHGVNKVAVIDTATNSVISTVKVGKDPIGVGMSPDGTLVYAANSNDTVWVIDVATNTVVGTKDRMLRVVTASVV